MYAADYGLSLVMVTPRRAVSISSTPALATPASLGPWFSTQLTLSLAIGLTAFFLFCFLRTRWEIVYMGRTKLKGELLLQPSALLSALLHYPTPFSHLLPFTPDIAAFVQANSLTVALSDFSPTHAHSPDTQSSGSSRFLGWILPTLRTSEFTVLQTVGLDAAVVRPKPR